MKPRCEDNDLPDVISAVISQDLPATTEQTPQDQSVTAEQTPLVPAQDLPATAEQTPRVPTELQCYVRGTRGVLRKTVKPPQRLNLSGVKKKKKRRIRSRKNQQRCFISFRVSANMFKNYLAK